jgi:hypothetical protein
MTKPQTSISGIIIPVEWDKNGEIINTAIVTFDEDRFVILNNRSGRVLMNYLRKTVTITGHVTFSGSIKKIDITRYQIH